ncbi:type II secretion system F family protein [Humisphaera borealis]|uniref:Type II secretion system F family protein n=2 Tax=Humisphaera borealis TaxID=2807512 RepID=A0A7M2WTY7_9BACT|nr:type II secretion system F family protein [Humisphaera borealis]
MDSLDPTLVKLISSLCFGMAAALLGFAGYRSLQSDGSASNANVDPSMRRSEMRRRAMQDSPGITILLAWLRIPATFISRLGLPALRKYVRAPYARAGYPGGLDDDELLSLGVVLGIVMAVFSGFSAAVVFGPQFALLGIGFLPAGFLVMVSSLKSKAEARELRIVRSMPYVLDLIVLILRSGTSLNVALQRVVKDYADHPVGDELGQVLAEIDMGSPRVEALRRWADRVPSPDINALADSIVQSEELGWPLADTLERQADRMAAERVLQAQSKAGAAGVMVMIPSTLVLVAAVILLFGPMLVRFLQGGFQLK